MSALRPGKPRGGAPAARKGLEEPSGLRIGLPSRIPACVARGTRLVALPVTLKKRTALGVAGLLSGALLTLLALNLSSGSPAKQQAIDLDYGVRDPRFARALSGLLGPPVQAGNRVQALENGVEIFPAMLAAIRAARRTITFETYIYWSGEIGREFSQALSERAHAGVTVHLMIDWVGAGKIDDAQIEAMRAAGVHVERYHPLAWWSLDRVNNRTHRKLLLVDGQVAFTGGVGIADLWLGDADSPEHWRDTHFRIEGPAVAQAQTAFMENWLEIDPEVRHGDGYFPVVEPAGEALAQFFSSSPDAGSSGMRLLYLLAIEAARETIHLASSYFVPDDASVEAIAAAARRGVRVEILLPGTVMDVEIVQKASRSRWGALLEAGVLIFEYQPTMLHRKVLVVDGHFVSAGSTNFDDRSFRLNDETNLNVFDDELAADQIAAFERDRAASTEVTLETWLARPWREKLAERTAGLLRSQL